MSHEALNKKEHTTMKRLLTNTAMLCLAAAPAWSAPGESVPLYVDFFPLTQEAAVETTWAHIGDEWRLLSIRDFVGPVHSEGFDAFRAIRSIDATPVYVLQSQGSMPAEVEAFHTALFSLAGVHQGVQASLEAADEELCMQAVAVALFDRTKLVDWTAIDKEALVGYLTQCLNMKRDQAILRFAASGGTDSTGFARGMGLGFSPSRTPSSMLQRVAAAMAAAKSGVSLSALGSKGAGLMYVGPTPRPCNPCAKLFMPWPIPCSTCCYAGCNTAVPFGGSVIL